MLNAPEQLLKKSVNDPMVAELLKSLAQELDIDDDPDDDVIYYTFQSSGFDFLISRDTDLIDTVHLFHQDHDPEVDEFKGTIPSQLNFELSKADCRSRLGDPTISGEYWDKWEMESHSVHVQYKESEESIRLITVMG